jgi:hypothetical protein
MVTPVQCIYRPACGGACGYQRSLVGVKSLLLSNTSDRNIHLINVIIVPVFHTQALKWQILVCLLLGKMFSRVHT